MISLSPDIASEMIREFWHFVTILLRVSAFVSVMPAFGERWIPIRVKLAVAVAFALIVHPAVPIQVGLGTFQDSVALVGTEILAGLTLGIGLRLFVLALQTAGSVAAQATSLSQILGGAAAEPVPAMSHLLVLAGLALATLLDLHVRAAELLILSYSLFPLGALPEASDLSRWGVSQIANSFSLAFALAAPFVIASLIYNLTLGVINRAMPQLMVAFVGAPAITFGGLVLLFACTGLILSVWVNAVFDFFLNPLEPPS